MIRCTSSLRIPPTHSRGVQAFSVCARPRLHSTGPNQSPTLSAASAPSLPAAPPPTSPSTALPPCTTKPPPQDHQSTPDAPQATSPAPSPHGTSPPSPRTGSAPAAPVLTAPASPFIQPTGPAAPRTPPPPSQRLLRAKVTDNRSLKRRANPSISSRFASLAMIITSPSCSARPSFPHHRLNTDSNAFASTFFSDNFQLPLPKGAGYHFVEHGPRHDYDQNETVGLDCFLRRSAAAYCPV